MLNLLICVCRKPWTEEEGDTVVQCEHCKLWLHYQCIGVDKEVVRKIERFVCMKCAMLLLNTVEKMPKEESQSEHLTLMKELDAKDKIIDDKSKDIEKLKMEKTNNLKKTTLAAAEHDKINNENNRKISELEKEVSQKADSLEIINRKCAQLNNQKIIWEGKEKELTDHIKELKDEISNLEKSNGDLQLEIKTHQKINEELITASSNKDKPAGSTEASSDKEKAESKSNKKEIDSLKLKVSNLEVIIKDKEKSIQSLTTENYSIRKEKERMGRIIDLYIQPSEGETPPITLVQQLPMEENNHLSPVNDNPLEQRTSNNPPEQHTTAENQQEPQEPAHHHEEQPTPRKCRYELRKKDLCRYKSQCRYDHNVTQEDRESIKKNRTTQRNQTSTAPCPTAFYGKRCTLSQCHLRHNLDKQRLRRGPCLYEFHKKNSCPHDLRCRFTHDLPTECLSDPNVADNISEKIFRSNNKEKIERILGKSVLDGAKARMAYKNGIHEGGNSHRSSEDNIVPVTDASSHSQNIVRDNPSSWKYTPMSTQLQPAPWDQKTPHQTTSMGQQYVYNQHQQSNLQNQPQILHQSQFSSPFFLPPPSMPPHFLRLTQREIPVA